MSGVFRVWDAKATHLKNHLHMSFSPTLSTEDVKSLFCCFSKPQLFLKCLNKIVFLFNTNTTAEISQGTILCISTIPSPQIGGKPEQGDPKPAGIPWNIYWARAAELWNNWSSPFSLLFSPCAAHARHKFNVNIPKTVAGIAVTNFRCVVGMINKCSPVTYI